MKTRFDEMNYGDLVMASKQNELPIYSLSKMSLIILLVYFAMLLISGVILSILALIDICWISILPILAKVALASLSICATFCGMKYIKVLYKACIDNRIITPGSGGGNYIELGNVIYFVFRPIFAFAFVIITIIALLSGMVVVTSSLDYVLNNRFLYLCIIISSILGYSVGDVLDKFDALSYSSISDFFANKL